jgi:hypothetical protein
MWRTILTSVLLGAACFTVSVFLVTAGTVLVCAITEPPDGGANIGLGLLTAACAMNLPVMIALVWWFSWMGKNPA